MIGFSSSVNILPTAYADISVKFRQYLFPSSVDLLSAPTSVPILLETHRMGVAAGLLYGETIIGPASTIFCLVFCYLATTAGAGLEDVIFTDNSRPANLMS